VHCGLLCFSLQLNYRNPYTYISVGDIVSTMMAVYGMMLLRGIFRPELESQFKLSGKVMCVQLALFIGVLPRIIIGILVANDVIQCGQLFPSKGRGESMHLSVCLSVCRYVSFCLQLTVVSVSQIAFLLV